MPVKGLARRAELGPLGLLTGSGSVLAKKRKPTANPQRRCQW